MGSLYEFGNNPFRDLLMHYLLNDIEITTDSRISEIGDNFAIILENLVEDENDLLYLDFDIHRVEENEGTFKYRILGNNSITSFWLLNILPRNVEDTIKNGSTIINSKQFKYNKKTRKVTIKNMIK